MITSGTPPTLSKRRRRTSSFSSGSSSCKASLLPTKRVTLVHCILLLVLLSHALPTTTLTGHPVADRENHPSNAVETVAITDQAPLIDTILEIHNSARAKYGSPPLVYSPELARRVTLSARRNAETCALVHYMHENLHMSPWTPVAGGPDVRAAVRHGVQRWHDEEQRLGVPLHDAAQLRARLRVLGPIVPEAGAAAPGPRPRGVLHVQQMVWRATQRVGCAYARRLGQHRGDACKYPFFLACEYDPKGNVLGQTFEGRPAPVARRPPAAPQPRTRVPARAPAPSPPRAPAQRAPAAAGRAAGEAQARRRGAWTGLPTAQPGVR